MANENPTWGEERIANELLLKLDIQVSPRTVRKYLPRRPPGRPRGSLRWATFLRLHAQGIIACDFLVAVTATFRLLYVFVVIEHRSRRLISYNVTAHPIAAWTLQQLRDAIGLESRYEYLLHDRDCIFAAHLDESIRKLGVRVLKSPPRCPHMSLGPGVPDPPPPICDRQRARPRHRRGESCTVYAKPILGGLHH